MSSKGKGNKPRPLVELQAIYKKYNEKSKPNVVDFHGFFPHEIEPFLKEILREKKKKGLKYLYVITGNGEGWRLREEVRRLGDKFNLQPQVDPKNEGNQGMVRLTLCKAKWRLIEI